MFPLIISLIVAYPLAYILSKRASGKTSTVIMMFILPMWINFMLRVLALQIILALADLSIHLRVA